MRKKEKISRKLPLHRSYFFSREEEIENFHESRREGIIPLRPITIFQWRNGCSFRAVMGRERLPTIIRLQQLVTFLNKPALLFDHHRSSANNWRSTKGRPLQRSYSAIWNELIDRFYN